MSEPGKHEDEDPVESGYADEPADPEYDEPDEEAPEVSYMEALRVWASAAWADGVIVEQEAEAMKGLIEGFALEEKERAQALSWIETRVEYESGEVGGWPYPVRLGVFRAAVEMVACDDEVVDTEQAFIHRLREVLRIDLDEAATLASAFADKPAES